MDEVVDRKQKMEVKDREGGSKRERERDAYSALSSAINYIIYLANTLSFMLPSSFYFVLFYFILFYFT